jgi:hypothetical protein
MRPRQAGFLMLVAMLSGCTPTSYQAHSYGGSASEGGPSEASSDNPVPASAEKASYSPSAPAGRDAVMPRERPGLGTVFGETRTSVVRRVQFDRASETPFARLAVHYNDADGIRAQLAYRGGEELSPLYATTPHGGISVALRDESGNVLPGRAAAGRTYVAGKAGDRYSLVIRNQTGGRFELVASVDGLDVIDGRPASLSKRGYILEPHGSVVIDGFRRSDRAVAAFRFGSVRDSYAARTTGDRNVGVIGFAFYAERGSEWTTDEIQRRETADPFPDDTRYAQPPP